MRDSSTRHLADLDPASASVIVELAQAVEAIGACFMIVGAFARDIWLCHCHGIPPSRKTEDIDFATAVESWEHYDKLRNYLLEVRGFRPSRKPTQPQRLQAPNGVDLDLLPFGGVEEFEDSDRVIRWPVDQSTMSVVGFQDALEAAVPFAIRFDHVEYAVSVLTVPSLVVLKLIAWEDRVHDTQARRKHVKDVYLVIDNYAAMNTDRVDEIDWDTAPNSQDEVGALLLGRDVAETCGPEAQARLRKRLEFESSPGGRCLLAQDLRKECYGQMAKARALLAALLKGLQESK